MALRNDLQGEAGQRVSGVPHLLLCQILALCTVLGRRRYQSCAPNPQAPAGLNDLMLLFPGGKEGENASLHRSLGVLSIALAGCLLSVLLTSVLEKNKAFSLLRGRKESFMR